VAAAARRRRRWDRRPPQGCSLVQGEDESRRAPRPQAWRKGRAGRRRSEPSMGGRTSVWARTEFCMTRRRGAVRSLVPESPAGQSGKGAQEKGASVSTELSALIRRAAHRNWGPRPKWGGGASARGGAPWAGLFSRYSGRASTKVLALISGEAWRSPVSDRMREPKAWPANRSRAQDRILKKSDGRRWIKLLNSCGTQSVDRPCGRLSDRIPRSRRQVIRDQWPTQLKAMHSRPTGLRSK
jgi:hypothetical protein